MTYVYLYEGPLPTDLGTRAQGPQVILKLGQGPREHLADITMTNVNCNNYVCFIVQSVPSMYSFQSVYVAIQ